MKLRDLCARAQSRPLKEDELKEFNEQVGGLDAALGARYTAIENGTVEMELDISDRVTQPFGIVHGGVYSALAESAASVGGLVATAGARGVAGISNSTQFVSSMSHGTITATARAVHCGRTLQLWDVTCRSGDRVLTTSSVRLIVLSTRMD
ncbi:MAG: PaaI family thioesterase [Corynebacterium glucuronolyticum]|nr:PaaI family thioesterase [Corynebacterium glucuronolyticum]